MKKIVAEHLTWLAPAEAQVGDWVLLPATTVSPGHWSKIVESSSDYDGDTRAVIALQHAQPTNKQLEEMENLYIAPEDQR